MPACTGFTTSFNSHRGKIICAAPDNTPGKAMGRQRGVVIFELALDPTASAIGSRPPRGFSSAMPVGTAARRC